MNEPTPGHTPSPKSSTRKRHRPSRITFVVMKHLLIAGVAVACAGLFLLLIADSVVMPLLIKSGSSIKAPELVGLPIDEVEHIADSLGVVILTDLPEYHNSFEENTVSFQYPFPGTLVKPGRSFRIRVSLGPRPVTMPDVVGRSRRDAELTINPYGLEIVDYPWIHSDDYVRGIVARQEPEGGTDIPENAEVILYISDGLPETNVVMPHLIELGLSAARDTLLFYGFNLDNVITHEEDAPHLLPETVIDQHPDPGADTNTDTEVDLIISASP